jgi:hypothetical protein
MIRKNLKFSAIIVLFFITWLFLFDVWLEMRNVKEEVQELSYKHANFMTRF